jgi:hypothetical protein
MKLTFFYNKDKNFQGLKEKHEKLGENFRKINSYYKGEVNQQ